MNDKPIARTTDADCCFCSDLDGRDRQFTAHREGFFNKVCLETTNFAAFPSLSPIARGHVLIIPKYHVTSLCQVHSSDLPELRAFVADVTRTLDESSTTVVCFEHGIGAGMTGGCGVTHAHMHLLPMPSGASSAAFSAIHHDYEFRALSRLEDMVVPRNRSRSYLLLGRGMENLNVAFDVEPPSQYMRRKIAAELGTSSWDWRDYSRWDLYEETQRRLTSYYRNGKGSTCVVTRFGVPTVGQKG